jgi:hypothetical protein
MAIEESRVLELRESVLKHAEKMKRLRLHEAIADIYLPRPAAHELEQGAVMELHDFAAETIGDVPMVYMEFGVAGGKSIRRMVERFTHPDARFFGFDSFEGIPEDWADKPRGSFSMKGKPPVMLDKRVKLIQGWFQDSVPGFLESMKKTDAAPVLVHYDADLYSSTLFLLCTLWHHIPDYYFIFDEFMSDEIVALHDFSRAFPVDIEFLCQTNAGRFPPQVLGRLKRRVAANKYEISSAG